METAVDTRAGVGRPGKWPNMYPVEAGIVTACHSGLGGTGAAMIVCATLLLKAIH